ncbi:cytochrome P450 [Embleya sp. AB8]|uniref:cytochrome P450 n=1 Tax=Embleya sp. AB8 TaxID=3156304 RepID=UPI003C753D29
MSTDEKVWACPFRHDEALDVDPVMARLRTEAPIARVRMPYGDGRCWLVTRYADVKLVTSDRRFSRAALIDTDFPRITPAPIAQSESINLMDPPTLNRVRGLIVKAFSNAQVERLRPGTQRVVDELLAGIAEHGAPADVVELLAGRLPLRTISELLGVPAADRPRIRGWAVAMMSMKPADRERAADGKARLRAYFADLSAARRADPGDDLISALATARVDDERLDDAELAVLTMLLMVTGHDTTTYEIANIVYTLLTHPDHLAALRAHPEHLPTALEELLRFIPFRQGVGIPRVALEDVDFDGVTVRAGDTVHVSYLTANRDDAVYDRADELDFDRERPAAHMTFGYGMHHCLGAHLAKMELEVCIGSLLARFPNLRLAVPAAEVEWNTVSIWRFPLTLPVAW